MRKLCLLFFCVFITFTFAQQQGVITYRVKILKNRNLREDIKNDMPEIYDEWVFADSIADATFKFNLKFKNKLSLFTGAEDYAAKYQGDIRDAVLVSQEMSELEHFFYFDRKNNLFVKQFNYWFSDLLIEDVILKHNWNLKNDIKVIGGYTCYKAVLNNYNSILKKNTETIAWYTLAINIPIGPLNYGGLPGLILRLDTDTHSYYATNIDFKKSELNILKPAFGKKMNTKEFNEIKDKLEKKGQKLIYEGRI
ncbi:GLPGLI family protein [Flavobacteriaceae bacterium]|nr:GLPGLI family protein [Flavobacteriaceae bacterium]